MPMISTPQLSTVTVTNIGESDAVSGGNVTSVGASAVIARGVCWSLTQNPTLTDAHSQDSIGSGTFISQMTGLKANTTYYVRAYAVNLSGTGYGNLVTFKTMTVQTPGFSVKYINVTIIDPNDAVQFSAQCTNTAVKITKVEILDPIHSGVITYNENGVEVAKGEYFNLQDVGTAYFKEVGRYQFTFTGTRVSDSAPFSITTSLNITK